MIQNLAESLLPYIPYVVLSFFVWLTYGYTLKCGFVIDDVDGIVSYDGKLQGLEYGMISRWLRYHICGGNSWSGKKDLNGKDIPQGKVPFRHHLLSVTIFNIAILLTYQFLASTFSPKLAFLGVLLFIVHPICIQGVAWISGLGYPLSLVWLATNLNLLHWYYGLYDPSLLLTSVVFVLFLIIQFLAINAQFATMMAFIPMAYLGWWPFSFLTLLMAVHQGSQIVRSTISLRTKVFKEQDMGASTYLHPRKLIVAIKTYYYYIRLMLFPKRLGLYHEWGYHYDKAVENENKMLLQGVLLAIVTCILFFY